MIKNRIVPVALVALILALTGCVPDKSAPGQHRAAEPPHDPGTTLIQMSVSAMVDGKPVAIPISMFADCRAYVGTPHEGHCTNTLTGQPYPSRWRGRTPEGSGVEYLQKHLPIVVTVIGNVTASEIVRSLKAHTRLTLMCLITNGNTTVPIPNFDGPQTAQATYEQAANGAIVSVGVHCTAQI